jgi:uncharacterized membrane protein
MTVPICQVCHREKDRQELVPAAVVRHALAEHIKKGQPNWDRRGYICRDDLNSFRESYIHSLIRRERGELTALEHRVAESLKRHDVLSANIDVQADEALNFRDRMSDQLAKFGGSWTFILVFAAVMTAWIAVNSIVPWLQPFDVYPYILLNLVLSCLAALQAPIIMMSQNRQEAKDRLRAQHDYQVNLKAELEIRHLHEKLDHLLLQQWERLVEIQQVQVELADQIRRHPPTDAT